MLNLDKEELRWSLMNAMDTNNFRIAFDLEVRHSAQSRRGSGLCMITPLCYCNSEATYEFIVSSTSLVYRESRFVWAELGIGSLAVWP